MRKCTKFLTDQVATRPTDSDCPYKLCSNQNFTAIVLEPEFKKIILINNY